MRLLFTLCFLLLSALCFAQLQKVTFYNKTGFVVDTRDSADFMRIISAPDSGSVLFNIKEYYKSGKPKYIGTAKGFNYYTKEGEALSFFENGRRMSVINYKNGRPIGDNYEYFPNGKLYLYREYLEKHLPDSTSDFVIKAAYDSLGNAKVENGDGILTIYTDDYTDAVESGPIKDGKKEGLWTGQTKKPDVTFEETYNAGTLLTGTAKSEGKVTNYKIRYIVPQFQGGVKNLMKLLAKNIRYPSEERNNGIQGIVILSFAIDPDGKLTDVKVIHSVSPGIDAVAVSALKKLPRWVPGQRFGSPVRVQYSIPVAFALGSE